MAFGHADYGFFTGVEYHVPHVHFGKRFGGAFYALISTGDQAQVAGIIGQIDHRNIVFGQMLITGRGGFVFGRQVHPQLHHLKEAAGFAEFLGMELFVDDAVTGGHPLYVAFFDHAAAAAGIAVRHFAVVGDGNGFKTFVRMLADAARTAGAAGREFARSGVIEHQKGIGTAVFAHM